ncbi:sialate O-acetylesterase [Dawidia soli]|uniref:Sialate O-acetylesterase domain-containing protein n=1 Tax=Dawidia soli TaxID=2782352 RepID=A0AAP2GIN9_9BACT|nr:sialate O-acetylesterase [Dawidia soli]MBT1687143.1 hypothetical protein [Dawidia soli]
MRILFTLWVLHMVGLGYAQDLQLYLLAGQSNAVGQGDSALSPACSAGTAWEYIATRDALVVLRDPFGQDELHFQRAHTGSLAPALAEALYRRTGKPVVLVAAARGGSACHTLAELNDYGTWDVQGRLLLMPFAIQKVQAAERKTGKRLQGVVWVQGERDANAITMESLLPGSTGRHCNVSLRGFARHLGRSFPFILYRPGIIPVIRTRALMPCGKSKRPWRPRIAIHRSCTAAPHLLPTRDGCTTPFTIIKQV